MTLDELLARLDGVTRSGTATKARCPAHEDRKPSLSVKEGDDAILLYCFAGCTLEEITKAIGIRPSDLFLDDRQRKRAERPQIVKVYPYHDEHDAVLFEVVRFRPKDFRQRRPDGRGGHVWRTSDVRKVLYQLPELIEAVSQSLPVFVVEGEKDVDALRAAGEVATCNPGGAGKWHAVANHAREVLAGAYVLVVADRDRPGRRHARDVVESLRDVAAMVQLVEPAHGKDAAEHLGAGLGAIDFVEVDPDAERDGDPSEERDDESDGPHSSTSRSARMVSVSLGDVQAEAVSWLWRGHLPYGKLVVFDGDPSTGKSTLALDLAARTSTGAAMPDDFDLGARRPGSVVLMSAEDGLADTIKPRLIAAGADMSRIESITEVEEDRDDGTTTRMPTLPDDIALLEAKVIEHQAVLVVIDVFTAYLSSETNSYRDQDIRRAMAPMAAMAERQRCCILVLRHLRKSSSGSAIYAGGGSIAIVGAARVGLMAAFDPDDEDVEDLNERRRVLAVVKNNVGRMAPSLSYRIESVTVDVVVDGEVGKADVGRIEWLGEVSHHADDLVDRSSRDEQREEKETFLRELLADGPVWAKDVEREAHEAGGWTLKQLESATRRVGVRRRREGFGADGKWWWELVEPSTPPIDPKDPYLRNQGRKRSMGDGDGDSTEQPTYPQRSFTADRRPCARCGEPSNPLYGTDKKRLVCRSCFDQKETP